MTQIELRQILHNEKRGAFPVNSWLEEIESRMQEHTILELPESRKLPFSLEDLASEFDCKFFSQGEKLRIWCGLKQFFETGCIENYTSVYDWLRNRILESSARSDSQLQKALKNIALEAEGWTKNDILI